MIYKLGDIDLSLYLNKSSKADTLLQLLQNSKFFTTGSRTYGFPTLASDLDIVCLIKPAILEKLIKLSDLSPYLANTYNDNTIIFSKQDFNNQLTYSLRFDKINIVATSFRSEFRFWNVVTNELIAMKPVVRDFAKNYFKRSRVGLFDWSKEGF